MTLVAIIAGALLVLLSVTRSPSGPPRRGLAYWWGVTSFGLAALNLLLVACSIVDFGDEAVGLAFVAPSLVVSVGMVFRAVADRGSISAAGLLYVAPVLVGLAFAVAGASFVTPLLAVVGISVGVFLPRMGYSTEDISAGLVASVRLAGGALLLTAVAGVPGLVGQCRMDKCSVWGAQIGGGGTANGFGMVMAVLGLLIVLRLSAIRAASMLLGTLLLVDLSSSRSALLILAFGLAAVGVERWFRGGVLAGARTGVLASAVASVVVIAWNDWPPDDFTGRAKLWAYARLLVEERPVLGWGNSHWVRQAPSTLVDANYSTHNLLLELLVGFGVVGTVAVLAAIALSRWLIPAGSAASLWHVATTCLICGGAIEVLAAPGRSYLLQAAGILPLLLVAATDSTARDGEPATLDALPHRSRP